MICSLDSVSWYFIILINGIEGYFMEVKMIISEITQWIFEAYMLGIFMIGLSIFMFFSICIYFIIKDRGNV